MKNSEPYPLGFVSGADEITTHYADEAQMLGVITIMWNRLELHLKDLFLQILGSHREFAVGLWDAENTHRGRMKLIRLALDHIELTEARRAYLAEIVSRVTMLAEKRNALTHGEYVVDDGESLKARTARAKKPPTYMNCDIEALQEIIDGLEMADGLIARLSVDYLPQDLRQQIAALAETVRNTPN